jgi:hypothetical protein
MLRQWSLCKKVLIETLIFADHKGSSDLHHDGNRRQLHFENESKMPTLTREIDETAQHEYRVRKTYTEFDSDGFSFPACFHPHNLSLSRAFAPHLMTQSRSYSILVMRRQCSGVYPIN